MVGNKTDIVIKCMGGVVPKRWCDGYITQSSYREKEIGHGPKKNKKKTKKKQKLLGMWISSRTIAVSLNMVVSHHIIYVLNTQHTSFHIIPLQWTVASLCLVV